ncbi:MAG: aldo/keto reductase [Spirochaetes bacterium GWB1_66_5]|nr:MAG: aldo/keto reductase [Spirochaetes bacterium GWB1_66_5]
MKYRQLGRTGMNVSEISFGAWAIGASWGKVDDKDSLAALHKAVDWGVNFFDTADVYGMGRSEKLIARLLKERKETIYVATKAGRKLDPHVPEKYTAQNIRRFVDDSLKNLELQTLDLLQLHCPPTAVYYTPELFYALDEMVKSGKLRNYGVSVEKVEEALKAIEYPGVKTVQIIFNMFRQRPAELFFREARAKRIGILARVPLASGLLSGKMTRSSRFARDDHRNYNRKGQAFDRGETFSGVDFEKGLKAVEELKRLLPSGFSMPQFALRWILMHDAVSCAIPGAKRPEQAADNCAASDLPRLSGKLMRQVQDVYDKYVREDVHQRW